MTTREQIKKMGGTGFRSENPCAGYWVAGCLDGATRITREGATREEAEGALVCRMRERRDARAFA
jgi:hypothetical protein